MKQIILKDKVIYITENSYEIKRLKGKWLQSFFQHIVIRSLFAIIVLLAFMALLLFLMQVKIEFSHFSGIIGGGLFMLILFFLGYYNKVTIPIGKIQKTYINKQNQLIINYTYKNKEINKAINLPKEKLDREQAIKELQEQGVIQADVPQTSYGNKKCVHKMNLYMGIIGVCISTVFYFVLFNITINQWAIVLNSIILLFCILAILFSSYKLWKIKAFVHEKEQ